MRLERINQTIKKIAAASRLNGCVGDIPRTVMNDTSLLCDDGSIGRGGDERQIHNTALQPSRVPPILPFRGQPQLNDPFFQIRMVE